MKVHRMFERSLILLVLSAGAYAQKPADPGENGAVILYGGSGWSFGLPAVRAGVSVPGAGTALSPEKKTLIAPSVGVGVRAWRWVTPFVDFTAYDTGKATAQVGSVRSEVSADTYSVNAGVRLIAGKSKARGYVEFGGGVVHQSLKGDFVVNGQSTPASASDSIGTFMYGAGVQLFVGRKWGTDIGFDGFRAGQEFAAGGRNFSRVRVGFFYQTRSSLP